MYLKPVQIALQDAVKNRVSPMYRESKVWLGVRIQSQQERVLKTVEKFEAEI